MPPSSLPRAQCGVLDNNDALGVSLGYVLGLALHSVGAPKVQSLEVGAVGEGSQVACDLAVGPEKIDGP